MRCLGVWHNNIKKKWLYLHPYVEVINACFACQNEVKPISPYKKIHIDKKYSMLVMLKYRNQFLQRKVLFDRKDKI